MCGIVGIHDSNGRINKDNLVRMRDSMAHRGPDDAGVYINETRTMGLGHRRLSIIDLSDAGHQPMCNEDQSVWIVFNGEIYNYQLLTKTLTELGHRFRSKSDTEVIIRAYEQWGTKCVNRLRGMFAFAVLDESKNRLFLARDRLGIKPLYYSYTNGRLLFASELKGIVADEKIRLTIDESSIYDFFTYRYIPTPKTIYKEVEKLPPAHIATFENGRLTVSEYWDVEFGQDQHESDDQAAGKILDKLRESIELHLISDVPLGVMLSGGLDSSTLTALSATSKKGLSHTFTIGFDVKHHDESHFAKLVANKYRTVHHEHTVTYESAKEAYRRIIDLYDEPFADSSAIPTLSVCKLARQHVKVALSGEGGDEIFGGYTRYPHWLQLSRADFISLAVRRYLFELPAKLLPLGFKGKWSLHAAALDPIERYAEFLSPQTSINRQSFFSNEFREKFKGYDDFWYYRKFWRTDLDPYTRMQYLDIKTYLHDDILTKMDRASMAVSLEARVPLLDHELINAVFNLPVSTRNKGYAMKYILKQAIREYLPQELLVRKKQGFSVPFHSWLDDSRQLSIDSAYSPVFDSRALRCGSAVTQENYWPLRVMNSWLSSNC